MNARRLSLALFTAGMVAASAVLTASHSAPNDGMDEIVRAYMEAPAVAAEIENYRKAGYHDRGARGVEVSGSCGVAGCYVECLVVHLFSTPGVNPQSKSILARVQVLKPSGRPQVELVELRPKSGGPVSDGSSTSHEKVHTISTIPSRTAEISAVPESKL